MIITHPGQAHRDDFISCCLIMSEYGGKVYRRNPTKKELLDSDIFVVDIGGEYNPEFRNFDHHQFPRDHEPTCALTQVMKYMELDYSIFPWFPTTELLDSKGPFQFCSKAGISKDLLDSLQSPIEGYILRSFSEKTQLTGGYLYNIMADIGKSITSYVKKVQERLAVLSKCSIVGTSIRILDARIDREDPTLALELFCKRMLPEPIVTVTLDDRGDGFCLFRRNDDPRIDFSRLEGVDGVTFAHKNGFIAKTMPNVNVYNLIEKAII